MSWLSNLFDQLFNRKRESTNSPKQAVKSNSAAKKGAPRQNFETDAEYSEHSLGHLLKQIPRPTPETYAYDLNTPPEISKEARDHLQARITQIPPMPEIWHRVQEILQRDDASASDLGQCVAQDPVLTAHILQVCNSSAYAATGGSEISNIPLAIARLGLDEASSVIFRALAPNMGGSEQRKLEIRHVWFHSQAIALLSKILAEPSHQLSRHDATMIGMLHDIGKLVILHLEPEQQLNRLKASIEQSIPVLVAEQQALGYTHIDAGMMLALHWRLPKQVRSAIAFHHHPTVMKANDLPQDLRQAMMVVHTAHLILQHVIQTEPKAEGDAENGSVWHSHQRTCLFEIRRFVQQEMSISLSSESFYGQVVAEIERLKLSFPDLFTSEAKSD